MPLLDKLREQYGVGPVCSELHIARQRITIVSNSGIVKSDKRSARAQRDDWLKRDTARIR